MSDTPEYVIATENLYVSGILAHVAGDQVPVVNVEPNGWSDKVTALEVEPGSSAPQEFNLLTASIPDVMTRVGENAALAADFAGREKGRTDAPVRTSLVEKLEKVATAQ